MDTVWDLEFTERKLLDNTIEEELANNGEKAFLTLYKCVLARSTDQQQSPNRDGASLVNIVMQSCTTLSSSIEYRLLSYVKPQSIWAILGENCVSLKSLVAVLSSFILAGKTRVAAVQQRVSSLHAASVYILLLGIPGKQI